MSVAKIIENGLVLAEKDYSRIAKLKVKFDVKPKEDQVKCALYKAFCDNGYLVHIEASYAKNGERCDLLAIKENKNFVAIEIKTAWAGKGWVNKPVEQVLSWLTDIEKLRGLIKDRRTLKGYFILCFAYENGSKSEAALRKEIYKLPKLVELAPVKIEKWNGLTELQFFVVEVC